MKNLFRPIMTTAIVCVVSAQIYAQKMPKQYTSAQLRNNISVFGAGFNKEETKILVGENHTGTYNAYLLDAKNLELKPLTNFKTETTYAVDVIPNSDQFLYSQDNGGDENGHLFLQNLSGGQATDITPWKGSRNDFLGWSKDKKSFYVQSNKRDPKFFDVLKFDLKTLKPEILYQNEGSGLSVSNISPDEKYLALTKSITTDKNELYIYNRLDKTLKKISSENEARWSPLVFEKDSKNLYYSTNDGNEYTYLVKYNLATGKSEKYFEDKWDVVGMNLSETGKYHSIFVNDDGKNKILLFDHASNKPINFPEIKGADVEGINISPSESKILISAGSSTSPNNLYLYNIGTKELKKLTNTLNKEVDENDLVKAEIIRFKSFDGLEIPAIYYKPLQASKNNKVGALVWVHGGPGGQSRADFSNSIQYLVNHGYAVLAVNNRGSSGYGKTFFKMDNKQHGYGDLQDCIWAKKWLQSQDYIDANAIGIYGGSYGGNMVLNALALHPDEFNVGVDLFGVANWIRTLESIPAYWEDFRKALYEEMGDPNNPEERKLLEATSPLFNYKTITKPLLVFQGDQDVRVLKVESDEIVEGVKKNGVPVEYYVFPQEGHGFQKKENLITMDEKTVEFLNKYLRVNK